MDKRCYVFEVFSMADDFRRLLLLVAALSLVGKLGEAAAPALLVVQQPLLLLVLNASDALCLITAAACKQPAARLAWWVVAWMRRMFEDGLHYTLGHLHGNAAASWVGVDLKEYRGRRTTRSLSLLFLGCVFPSLPACVAVGCSGTTSTSFLAAHGTATAVRLLALSTITEPLGVQTWHTLIATHRIKVLVATVMCAVPGALAAGRDWQRSWAAEGAVRGDIHLSSNARHSITT